MHLWRSALLEVFPSTMPRVVLTVAKVLKWSNIVDMNSVRRIACTTAFQTSHYILNFFPSSLTPNNVWTKFSLKRVCVSFSNCQIRTQDALVQRANATTAPWRLPNQKNRHLHFLYEALFYGDLWHFVIMTTVSWVTIIGANPVKVSHRNLWQTMFFKMGHSQPLLLYFRLFYYTIGR